MHRAERNRAASAPTHSIVAPAHVSLLAALPARGSASALFEGSHVDFDGGKEAFEAAGTVAELFALYLALVTSAALPAQPGAPAASAARAGLILASLAALLWASLELRPHAGPAGWLVAVRVAELALSAVTTISAAASASCAPSFALLEALQWALLLALAAFVAFNVAAVAALELTPTEHAAPAAEAEVDEADSEREAGEDAVDDALGQAGAPQRTSRRVFL
jgi:hypothetical protein